MNLQELLALQPRVHDDGSGNPTSWGLYEDALRFIEERVPDGARTLETGEGLSTILLAAKGCHHTAVTPNRPALDKIEEFCGEHGISLERLSFVVEMSQRALPALELLELDFVLIDGCHGFPAPFIDWFYAAIALKPGGVVLVDDTQIWTGEVLEQFLASQEGAWRRVASWEGRAAAFEKVGDPELFSEWTDQPYVIQRSSGGAAGGRGGLGGLLRRAAGRA
jgi:hypothetical protein